MIDVHLHAVAIAELFDEDPNLARAADEVFSVFFPPTPIAGQERDMDAAGISRSVVIPLDCTTAHGATLGSNEQIAKLVDRSERLLGFGSVDPSSGDAIAQLERAVGELGLLGIALDPALQQFDLAGAEPAMPVFRRCAELGVPVLVQCGLNWAIPARCSLGHPLALERAVHELPKLKVVISGAGFPWVADALLLALKYPNVHLDTAIVYSGTPIDSVRHVFAEQIGLDVVDRSLHRQVVFGSGSPRVAAKRVSGAVRELGLSSWLLDRISTANATELLGLGKASS
jgi:uncharacterized protein